MGHYSSTGNDSLEQNKPKRKAALSGGVYRKMKTKIHPDDVAWIKYHYKHLLLAIKSGAQIEASLKALERACRCVWDKDDPMGKQVRHLRRYPRPRWLTLGRCFVDNGPCSGCPQSAHCKPATEKMLKEETAYLKKMRWL